MSFNVLCIDEQSNNKYSKQWNTLTNNSEEIKINTIEKTCFNPSRDLNNIHLVIIHNYQDTIDAINQYISENRNLKSPFIMVVNIKGLDHKLNLDDGCNICYTSIPFSNNQTSLSHLTDLLIELAKNINRVNNCDFPESERRSEIKIVWKLWETHWTKYLIPALDILCQGYLIVHSQTLSSTENSTISEALSKLEIKAGFEPNKSMADNSEQISYWSQPFSSSPIFMQKFQGLCKNAWDNFTDDRTIDYKNISDLVDYIANGLKNPTQNIPIQPEIVAKAYISIINRLK